MLENHMEKAIMIAVQTPDDSDEKIENSLEELRELAKTDNLSIVGTIIQKRPRLDRNNYFGKGKMGEIKQLAEQNQANLIIADDELNSLQNRRLEEGIGIPILDRTALILEIFASHASSKEGQLQVDLAQTQYKLLRLAGGYVGLSRQRGGIGTKGPGETKIESDRRVLRKRVQDLQEELEKVVQDRQIQRQKRTDRFAPLFAMVGYTNVGKSTLLNTLTNSNITVCDGLFTTLAPTARKLSLPSGRQAIISDTVGFIRKLPHCLVKAFRATLEDVINSQVIVHVADFSNPQLREHIESVRDVLRQMDVLEKETLLVFNKIDSPSANNRHAMMAAYPDSLFISARTGEGLQTLKEKMDSIVVREFQEVTIFIPRKDPLLKEIFNWGKVITQEWSEDGVVMRAEISRRFLSQVKTYLKE